MTTQHTPEPWVIRKGLAKQLRVESAGGLTVISTVNSCMDESDANARRIVACVNACAGTTTSDLEQIAAHGGWLHVSVDWKLELESAEQQRDELLEKVEMLNSELAKYKAEAHERWCRECE